MNNKTDKNCLEDFELHIKVTPKGSKNEIMGWENNELKVRLKAVPENGKANAELIKFIAVTLEISQTQVQLIAGMKSRHKRLKIVGMPLNHLNSGLFTSPSSKNSS